MADHPSVTDPEDANRATPQPESSYTPELQPLAEIREVVARVLHVPPATLSAEEDLLNQGLDSLGVMRVANLLKRSGTPVSFSDLIGRPTLAEWAALMERQAGAAAPQPRARTAEGEPFDLAPMQQAYWIGANEISAADAVNAHYYVELDGADIDPARLQEAAFRLFERHPLLRTRFLADCRQQTLPATPWQGLAVHDLSRAGRQAVDAHLDGLRTTLSHRRLAVGEGHVLDLQLTLLPGGRTRLHLNVEMLVCDARSFQILMSELARLYRDPQTPLPAIRYTFQQYLADLELRRGPAEAQARQYWEARIPELPGRPDVPLATRPEQLQAQTVRRKHWRLSVKDYDLLRARCRDHGLTPASVLATAYAEVIGLWSAEKRFLLNMPVFGREDLHPDVDKIVGDFTNLLILDVDVSENLGFADQARKLQGSLRDTLAHIAYSGLEVLRTLARRNPADWMMAPIVFTSALGSGDLFDRDVRGTFGAPVWISSQTPQVWLDFQVIESEGGLLLNWDIVPEVFPEGVADAMFEAYCRVVSWLVEPGSDWSALPDLVPEEQIRSRHLGEVHSPLKPDRLLHGDFFERAAAEPDRPALLWGESGERSYGALAAEALSIAEALVERGVQPGQPVAVSLSRGPEQVSAVLGVLAAGAAYVPVSPEQPDARRTRIYQDAGVRVVLTGPEVVPPADISSEIEFLDAARESGRTSRLERPVGVAADDLAYIIYTSGSTGAPKGVEMCHRAAMNTIDDVNRRFGVSESDRVLAVSSLDFDLSVYDLFGLLSVGGAVVLLDEGSAKEAALWVRLAQRRNVSIWNSVPAILDMLLSAASAKAAPLKLRLALVSGDWIGLDLPGRLRQLCPESRFIGLGGATEAAIWSNAFEVDEVDPAWPSIPYGRPLSNQKYRVVDSRGRDCPDFVPGELWIGGMGVARGYRGDEKKTRAQFASDQGERWYRTGDIGRFWSGGILEFQGRRDSQVKLNGYRIELGEIEAALRAHPDVETAVALVIDRSGRNLAAVARADPEAVDADELRRFMALRLPGQMIPDAIRVEAALPLTLNGKLDRRMIQSWFEQTAAPTAWEPPRTNTERALAVLWGELLPSATSVGRSQSFFEVGGNSLVATNLLVKLGEQFGVEIRLQELLGNASLTALAGLVEAKREAFEEGEI